MGKLRQGEVLNLSGCQSQERLSQEAGSARSLGSRRWPVTGRRVPVPFLSQPGQRGSHSFLPSLRSQRARLTHGTRGRCLRLPVSRPEWLPGPAAPFPASPEPRSAPAGNDRALEAGRGLQSQGGCPQRDAWAPTLTSVSLLRTRGQSGALLWSGVHEVVRGGPRQASPSRVGCSLVAVVPAEPSPP